MANDSSKYASAIALLCLLCVGTLHAQEVAIPTFIQPTTLEPIIEPTAREAAPAPPNPYEGDLFTRERLLGDLGGRRSALLEKGVRFDLFATQFYQG